MTVKSPTKISAPIGLDLETIAEEVLKSPKKTASTGELLWQLEPIEAVIRQYSAIHDSELAVAQWLNQLAVALEERHQYKTAEDFKVRSRTLVAKELNQLDGFDR